MNRELKFIIVDCPGADPMAGKLAEVCQEAMEATTIASVIVVGGGDPVPRPEAPDPIMHELLYPTSMNDNFYVPKARRQRKGWQRPYKYHR